MRLRVAALGLTLLTGPSLAFGAVPVLVRDIAQGPDGEQLVPDHLISVGERAVFFLTPGGGFRETPREPELWTTNGMASGTERLRSFSGQLRSLGGNGRIAFFARFDFDLESNTQIRQLWRTDGTAAGTFLLSPAASPAEGELFSTIFQGSLVFEGCTPQAGCELWASDGSTAGTRQLSDLTPGPGSSEPHDFASAGGRLYFLADDPTGPALWATDGTTPGTKRVATLPPFTFAHDLTAAGNRMFFLEGPADRSLFRLWTTDGTAAGTRRVPPFDQDSGKSPGIASVMGSLGGSLLFIGFNRADGYQAWATDGTPHGTLRLTSWARLPFATGLPVFAGAALGGRFVFQGFDQHLWTTRGTRASTGRLTGCPSGCPEAFLDAVPVVLGDKLFFTSETLNGDEQEPWVTDGTAAGTLPLARLCPPPCSFGQSFIAVALGSVFFAEGPSLWATDGTPGGTRLLGDENVAGGLVATGSRAVFATYSQDSGPGLGVTDGTPGGTQTLDVRVAHGAGSNPSFLLPFGNEVRFLTCGNFPSQLWTSDGTAGGTLALTDEPVSCSSLAKLGGDVYFFSGLATSQPNLQLWRSDGTPGGALPITPIAPGLSGTTLGAGAGRLVFFLKGNLASTTELWTSDGTAQGTVRVIAVPDRELGHLAILPGEPLADIFFQGLDAESRITLWHSDGTPEGTAKLLTFFFSSADLTGFTRFNGAVYFSAAESGLWKTDSTVAGTRQILSDRIAGFLPFGGALFVADASTDTLLRSDGTVAGTNFIANLSDVPFSGLADPQLTAVGDILYFVATDTGHGTELWRTDGTRAGSRIVADIAPGQGSSVPAELTAAGGLLYFTANDGEHGRELWVTDGTAAGTRQVADIAAGPGSSSPMELTVAGDHLFFSADDGFTGRELWLLPLDPTFR